MSQAGLVAITFLLAYFYKVTIGKWYARQLSVLPSVRLEISSLSSVG